MIKKAIYIIALKFVLNLIYTYERIFFTCDDCKLNCACRNYPTICKDFHYKYINDDEIKR